MSLRRSALITVIATSILVACNNKEDNDTTNQTSGQTSDDTGANIEKSDAVAGAPDPAMFQDNALTEEVSTIDCTLSDGTETSCYRISIAGKPSTMDEGPSCPPSITSDSSTAGSWFGRNGEMIAVDGA